MKDDHNYQEDCCSVVGTEEEYDGKMGDSGQVEKMEDDHNQLGKKEGSCTLVWREDDRFVGKDRWIGSWPVDFGLAVNQEGRKQVEKRGFAHSLTGKRENG